MEGSTSDGGSYVVAVSEKAQRCHRRSGPAAGPRMRELPTWADLAKLLGGAFGIEDGLMSTVRAHAGDQRLIDWVHTCPRRARDATGRT